MLPSLNDFRSGLTLKSRQESSMSVALNCQIASAPACVDRLDDLAEPRQSRLRIISANHICIRSRRPRWCHTTPSQVKSPVPLDEDARASIRASRAEYPAANTNSENCVQLGLHVARVPCCHTPA